MAMANDEHVNGLDFEAYKKFTEERLYVLAQCLYSVSLATRLMLNKSEHKNRSEHDQLDRHVDDMRKIEGSLYQYFLGD